MAGRKKIEYTEKQKNDVVLLSQIGCTISEIAATVGIPERSIVRHFGVTKKEGFEKFKQSIRRAQYKLLLAGNATMGIWLGKQYLGQKDSQEIDLNHKINITFVENLK